MIHILEYVQISVVLHHTKNRLAPLSIQTDKIGDSNSNTQIACNKEACYGLTTYVFSLAYIYLQTKGK